MIKQIAFILLVSQLLTSCSVFMALKQPDKKNLQVLSAGISRDNIIAQLGGPVSSDKTETGREDIYQFTQGYHGGTKASRALFHGVADVFTLFIWELIAMPTEAIIDGNEMTVKVIYDENDKAKEIIHLSQK